MKNMMIEVEIVGGPKDGAIVEVHKSSQYFEVPVQVPFSELNVDVPENPITDRGYKVYKLEVVKTKTKHVAYWNERK